MKGFSKIEAKYPEIQREVEEYLAFNSLKLRIGTIFDKEIYAQEYVVSMEEISLLEKMPNVLSAHDIIFQRMEEAMRRRIEEIKSAKVKYMVDQILNINPN